MAMAAWEPSARRRINPTTTLLEHPLLTQGFMGTSKAAFPRRLRPQNRDSTWANLVNTLKWRCRVSVRSDTQLGNRTYETRNPLSCYTQRFSLQRCHMG